MLLTEGPRSFGLLLLLIAVQLSKRLLIFLGALVLVFVVGARVALAETEGRQRKEQSEQQGIGDDLFHEAHRPRMVLAEWYTTRSCRGAGVPPPPPEFCKFFRSLELGVDFCAKYLESLA